MPESSNFLESLVVLVPWGLRDNVASYLLKIGCVSTYFLSCLIDTCHKSHFLYNYLKTGAIFERGLRVDMYSVLRLFCYHKRVVNCCLVVCLVERNFFCSYMTYFIYTILIIDGITTRFLQVFMVFKIMMHVISKVLRSTVSDMFLLLTNFPGASILF